MCKKMPDSETETPDNDVNAVIRKENKTDKPSNGKRLLCFSAKETS